MTLTHPAPRPTLTLEQRRDALTLTHEGLTAQRKALAGEVHRLKKDWDLLYPRSSRRQFILWLTQGEDDKRLKTCAGRAKIGKIKVFRRWWNTPERGAECAAQAELYRLTSLYPARGSWRYP